MRNLDTLTTDDLREMERQQLSKCYQCSSSGHRPLFVDVIATLEDRSGPVLRRVAMTDTRTRDRQRDYQQSGPHMMASSARQETANERDRESQRGEEGRGPGARAAGAPPQPRPARGDARVRSDTPRQNRSRTLPGQGNQSEDGRRRRSVSTRRNLTIQVDANGARNVQENDRPDPRRGEGNIVRSDYTEEEMYVEPY